MKKPRVHYQSDFETVTPCGIDIFEYRLHLVVSPQMENVSCFHCKKIMANKVLTD